MVRASVLACRPSPAPAGHPPRRGPVAEQVSMRRSQAARNACRARGLIRHPCSGMVSKSPGRTMPVVRQRSTTAPTTSGRSSSIRPGGPPAGPSAGAPGQQPRRRAPPPGAGAAPPIRERAQDSHRCRPARPAAPAPRSGPSPTAPPGGGHPPPPLAMSTATAGRGLNVPSVSSPASWLIPRAAAAPNRSTSGPATPSASAAPRTSSRAPSSACPVNAPASSSPVTTPVARRRPWSRRSHAWSARRSR